MKFGVREICDVVLKRKAAGYFGKLYLDKNMPVLYFDTLKTSSLEGQAATVYAQGGKGNPRLVAWEGDRTVTFTMEDALISPESFSILSGAGFIDAEDGAPIYVHTTEQVEIKNNTITLSKKPATKGEMYLLLMTEDGSINTSKLPMKLPTATVAGIGDDLSLSLSTAFQAWETEYNTDTRHVELRQAGVLSEVSAPVGVRTEAALHAGDGDYIIGGTEATDDQGSVIYVDYYVEAKSGAKQIDIEASKFGGSYYLEASTLFRDQATGEDYPAEFIIPNCKVQSNFTFTMAPTGDPSTFTFTMDAFPDYTKFDKTKKVIAALQIVEDKELFGAVAGGSQEEEPKL
jgi:hypothetical protein